jgi:predicted ATP-dependent protease
MGALIADFPLIKPGALHRANAGNLMPDTYKFLVQPFAWEGLKRALPTQEIRVESLGQMHSLVSTPSLEPQPVFLKVKVVLYCPRLLYYLLHAYDSGFGKLLKGPRTSGIT